MKLKYHIICFCVAWLPIVANAQVGINTKNALGVFHIDTRGDNNAGGMPSAAQMTDDIVVDANTITGVNMSVGGKEATNSSAQLALLDAKKAMLLNRVALTDLRDIVTVPNPQAGMLVYNTSTSGVYPDNVVPGFYYFNGIIWYKWQYGAIGSELSQHELLEQCYSAPVPSLDDPASPMLATLANFGAIKIKEKGTYVFAFRLYGDAQPNSEGNTAPPFARTINYMYLMKNGSTKVAAMEINVPLPVGALVAYTHTATMQAILDKDDIITIRLGHYQSTAGYGWMWRTNVYTPPVAHRTSLIYWKI